MPIRSLVLRHVALALKARVKHASHDRVTSDSFVVSATLDGGHVGHGEGVPRPYVTGETIDTAFQSLAGLDLPRALGKPETYAEVVRRLSTFALRETEEDPRGMAGNSARCALELALLDAYGHQFGEPLGTAVRLAAEPGLPLTPGPTHVRYSAAIMASSPFKEQHSALRFWLYGFHHVKVKVGVEGQDDPARLRALRRIMGRRMDIRLDANEAWPAASVAARARQLLPYRPSALEQPVRHEEADALAEIRREVPLPIMLDESLCGYPDAALAIERGTADLFNVRLSKCGGLLPSLKIMGLAARSGVGLQLGCHPGESGLLSAAGRHLAANVAGLRYVEGSYDSHVLARNITKGDITFGYGGWAPPLKGPGLGVAIDPEALDRMTLRREEIRYD